MKTTKLAAGATSLLLVGQLVFGASQVFAQSSNNNTATHENFFQGLVSMLTQKFGLDKTQVQTAITDYKKQNRPIISPRPTLTSEQIQAKDKARLGKLVTDGKITETQEQLIISGMQTLRTKYNLGVNKNLTPDERRKKIQSMQEDINAWAKSQNINPFYVMPHGSGMMEKSGKGMHRGFDDDWDNDKPNFTPSP